MKVSDFDYNLPTSLIAQKPLLNRSQSRLLVLDQKTGEIKHELFINFINYLRAGDVLVLNDTKVIHARLKGEKAVTHAKIEVFLLKESQKKTWECLVKPGRRVQVGTIVSFGGGRLVGECIAILTSGVKTFKFISKEDVNQLLDELGEVPLPPYIHETLAEKDRYQTVFANAPGSVAAPTAGLHFTPSVITDIKAKGVMVVYLTLHVGLGTFRPVKTEIIKEHHMHAEYYALSNEAAVVLNQAKANGNRIVGVGTTTVRALETIMKLHQQFIATSGVTDIFIYPPYNFKAVDLLLTNFHLPRSTLLMLVSAFGGLDLIKKAYREAIKEEYRFFSFGDCMLIK